MRKHFFVLFHKCMSPHVLSFAFHQDCAIAVMSLLGLWSGKLEKCWHLSGCRISTLKIWSLCGLPSQLWACSHPTAAPSPGLPVLTVQHSPDMFVLSSPGLHGSPLWCVPASHAGFNLDVTSSSRKCFLTPLRWCTYTYHNSCLLK